MALRERFRGTQRGGGMTVTPLHWWSPKDRRRAAIAAKILEHERGKLQEDIQAWVRAHMIYGGPPG